MVLAVVQKALPSDVCLDPRTYTHVLAGVQIDEAKIRYGLTEASINYRQPTNKLRKFADSCSLVSTH